MLRMKTISEIRYENLQKLVNELGGGDLTETLKKSKSWDLKESDNKLSRPTLDQILKKRTTANGAVKGVGDELARKIEDEFRLETGWMDNEHGVKQAAPPDQFSPEALAELIAVYCYTDDFGRRGILTAIDLAKSAISSAAFDKFKGRM